MIPYTTGARSGSKVPKSRSQTMNVPAKFRSWYSGFTPWCTRWCDGVFITHSSGPSVPTSRVWIQNW